MVVTPLFNGNYNRTRTQGFLMTGHLKLVHSGQIPQTNLYRFPAENSSFYVERRQKCVAMHSVWKDLLVAECSLTKSVFKKPS